VRLKWKMELLLQGREQWVWSHVRQREWSDETMLRGRRESLER
jgi:hypothetical protein